MTNDIMAVVGFIVIVVVASKVWNLFMMRQYDRGRKESFVLNPHYGEDEEKLRLAGTGIDENSDYTVVEAIDRIRLSDSTRIKIHE